MLFKKTETPRSTVRGQNGELPADSWEAVRSFLDVMFSDPDEFTVLSLAGSQPIRYVQAAWTADGFTVQLGVDKDGGTYLIEKICSEEECTALFREYYDTKNVSNIGEFTEVKF